jgi:hypothetical protein
LGKIDFYQNIIFGLIGSVIEGGGSDFTIFFNWSNLVRTRPAWLSINIYAQADRVKMAEASCGKSKS